MPQNARRQSMDDRIEQQISQKAQCVELAAVFHKDGGSCHHDRQMNRDEQKQRHDAGVAIKRLK
jgi:hypothetical protein